MTKDGPLFIGVTPSSGVIWGGSLLFPEGGEDGIGFFQEKKGLRDVRNDCEEERNLLTRGKNWTL